ncbi:MAG TPA: TlpA family protein disulfide reductase [Gammaproteobacteria bacterium]|nr:TlpA family protein disulfide reductase [Gammaproteobacteria bacterium]
MKFSRTRAGLIVVSVLIFLQTAFVQAADSPLDLSQYKGKAVYLDFWASWCVPCKKSFPWMQKMQRKYRDQGLQIVAVNLDEVPADADQFLSQFPSINFEIVRDPEGRLASQYSLVGMPTALLFDASGKQVGRHVGFKKQKTGEYEDNIKALLTSVVASKVSK